jgi:hypothetical protein
VRLTDLHVEGLVRVADLEGFYEFIEERLELRGPGRDNAIRLGDTFDVRVVSVDLSRRQVGFVPEESSRKSDPAATTSQSAKSGGGGAGGGRPRGFEGQDFAPAWRQRGGGKDGGSDGRGGGGGRGGHGGGGRGGRGGGGEAPAAGGPRPRIAGPDDLRAIAGKGGAPAKQSPPKRSRGEDAERFGTSNRGRSAPTRKSDKGVAKGKKGGKRR